MQSVGVRVVERFVEKPDGAAAVAWVEAGGWYWNSGMLAVRAARYLGELGIHAPSIRQAVESAHANAVPDLGFLRLDADFFARAPAVSMDHAVLEHTSDAVVVPLEAGWSDVGSWASLSAHATEDEAGNVVEGEAVLHGARGPEPRLHRIRRREAG